MLLGSSTWHSTKRLLTWKAPVTKQGRLYFRLVPSTPRISGCDALSLDIWATPTAMDSLPPRSPEALLRQAATTRKGRTRLGNLREQVDRQTIRLWPTPVARDYKGMGLRKNDLPSAVMMWPTPTTFDASNWVKINPVMTSAGTIKHLNRRGGLSRASLLGIVSLFPEPASKKTGNGRLNPEWVEWLMGFPTGWTELKR